MEEIKQRPWLRATVQAHLVNSLTAREMVINKVFYKAPHKNIELDDEHQTYISVVILVK